MSEPQILSDSQIETLLKPLPDWRYEQGKLYKAFAFSNFRRAFAFMSEVAMVAEVLDHHPDWFNSYNKVNIALFHHRKNAVTDLDIQFAKRIEAIYLDYRA